MRLDKFLVETGLGSRTEVKNLLKKGLITVNQSLVKEAKQQIDEHADVVEYDGKPLIYQEFYYYMLNKPAGVVSATQDNRDKTVIELLSKEDYRADLFPVGRLDKDTEGLLLLSNDGVLAHDLLSPKKHVDKEYFAQIEGLVTAQTIDGFEKGLKFKSGEEVKPAQLTVIETDDEAQRSKISLIIHEGKFHQVKRMFEAVGLKVIYLKRLRMKNLTLDKRLEKGHYRPLTNEEIKDLRNEKESKS
ncbi:MAG: rRNA pseudouridine synthase [Streptococcaceae bacterium]|nr:rRNA pseudouridine synthase [Streptococcaceae bacterium]